MIAFIEHYYWLFYGWDLAFRTVAYMTIIALLWQVSRRLR
mgnify:FL=1